MLIALSGMTWAFLVLWFIVYWILGGVFFAIVSATRFMNTRKALFSCLFTAGSVAAAYGASVTGLILAGMDRSARCPVPVVGSSKTFLGVLTCNYSAILVSGGLFFAILLTGGMVALLVSRVEKQK